LLLEAPGVDDSFEELSGAFLIRISKDLLGRAFFQDDPLVQEANL
jgi:hypothetical protein